MLKIYINIRNKIQVSEVGEAILQGRNQEDI